MLDKRAVGEAVASAVASLRCFIRLLQERGWSSWGLADKTCTPNLLV